MGVGGSGRGGRETGATPDGAQPTGGPPHALARWLPERAPLAQLGAGTFGARDVFEAVRGRRRERQDEGQRGRHRWTSALALVQLPKDKKN